MIDQNRAREARVATAVEAAVLGALWGTQFFVSAVWRSTESIPIGKVLGPLAVLTVCVLALFFGGETSRREIGER